MPLLKMNAPGLLAYRHRISHPFIPRAAEPTRMVVIDSAADVSVYQQRAAILRGKTDPGEIPPRRAIPRKRLFLRSTG